MLVHGLWDQEDIYGAPAAYRAIEPKDTANDKVYFVAGPWYHGQQIADGSALGAIRFDSDTAKTFRRDLLGPFLAQYLKDGAPKADIAPVTVFETGTNAWRRLNAWPAGCVSGCRIASTPLYLGAGQTLGFDAPKAGTQAFAEYVSDPSKPVPYRPRPVGSTSGPGWATWLVSDQREASGRTDVLTFVSAVLKEPVKISGQPAVNLVASTSGTDSDWVVKLIDVYPDQVPSQPDMGGYQLMVSADIFRGRYREGFESPKAITPDAALAYRLQPAEREPCLPAGPPHHGAGAIELVPALRPEPADIRAEHLLGEAGGLQEGRAACLPCAGAGELHRAADGGEVAVGRQRITDSESAIRCQPCGRSHPQEPAPQSGNVGLSCRRAGSPRPRAAWLPTRLPAYPIRCDDARSSVVSGSFAVVAFFHCCSSSSFAACSRNSGAAHALTSKSFLM